jgi:uroporphyrinogen decarboxylase
MIPRERVLAAFRHEVPDTVPAYVRNIMEWERHAEHFGVSSPDDLFALLGNAIRSFDPACLVELETRAGTGSDKDTRVKLTVWGVPNATRGTYTDTILRPLTHAETVSDVEAFKWPSGEEWDFDEMRQQLLAEKTCARLSPSWTPVFSRLCEVFGMEKAMVSLYTNRPLIEAALAHIDRFYTEFYGNILDTCGDLLDIFGLGDDFAGNDGMLIAPDLWRELFKPLYAKWLGMAKAKGLFTFMHSCGKIIDVLPDLIDIGLDAWQTVQTHLPGQSAAYIQREFGKHLTFVGAIDTTNVLGSATPDEVRQHVHAQIRALGAGGGYICAPDHTIMSAVPSENIAALYDGCREFRGNGYTLL